jgi:hypothetical protein
LPSDAETGLRSTYKSAKREEYAILSIDIAKVNPSMHGGHLVLVYGYDETSNEFLLHDCSSVVCQDGRGVKISIDALERISNNRGLIAG